MLFLRNKRAEEEETRSIYHDSNRSLTSLHSQFKLFALFIHPDSALKLFFLCNHCSRYIYKSLSSTLELLFLIVKTQLLDIKTTMH